jgi:Holliday junction DNA helicase RuvB
MPVPEPERPSLSPPTLDHVIGQRQVVDRLKVALEASFADNQPFPHTLLLGPPGLGKTTLAKLIATELASEFYEGLGQTLATPAALNGFLLKPTQDRAVLFIDEVHELPSQGQTALYRAMEERAVFLLTGSNDSITRLQTVRFTLVAATTDPQHLLPPLRDRFKLICPLQPYSEGDLTTILRQRIRQLGWTVADDCLGPIAARSFGTPRLAIRLLESVHRTARARGESAIVPDHLQQTFALEELDECGLGPDEQKYLRLLWQAKCPMRLGVLASKLKVSPRTVSQVIEERLLYLDLIERLPSGRVLTERGVEHAVRQETSHA